jgi:four helix bundle protein
VGSNAEEADGASSHDDFIAKNRIALKEAKETRFRLRVCQRTGLLSSEFYPMVQESDELVKILGKIVHNALPIPPPKAATNVRPLTIEVFEPRIFLSIEH